MYSIIFALISSLLIWAVRADFKLPTITSQDICKTHEGLEVVCWNQNVEIQLIDKELLKICNNVTIVRITGCDVEDGAFNETPESKILYLAYPNYTSEAVSVKTFDGLNNTQDVTIINLEGSVKKYEDLCFTPFKNVKKMYLSDFSAPAISPGMFKGLDNLHVLHLGKFSLKSVHWEPMPKLTYLRLNGYCDYTDFDMKAFSKEMANNFPALKELWLYEDAVPKEIRDIVDEEAKKLKIHVTWEEKYPTRIEF